MARCWQFRMRPDAGLTALMAKMKDDDERAAGKLFA